MNGFDYTPEQRTDVMGVGFSPVDMDGAVDRAMELIARRTIQEIEGDEGQKHIAEYADGSTERGKCLLKTICEQLGFSSLGYQNIDDLCKAIGLDRDQLCTYCWTGKE